MAAPSYKLKANANSRVLSGHPWVFANEVEAPLPPECDGEVVECRDRAGRFLGTGICNGRSQIVWRRLDRDRVALDEAYLGGALERAVARRAPGDFRRLVWSESDDLPGVVADQYGDTVVVQIQTLAMERRSALIGDLLDLSRIDAGKGLSLALEPVDMNELMQTVYETFKNASTRHKIILTLPEKSEIILVDKNKIIQVMTNLLSNALKYSPEGGEITIKTWFDDKMFYGSVKDQGLGIAEEDLGRIFDKFYRVESEKVKKIGGTGIGLPIVKYILELHNGNIRVISEFNKGSEFVFNIPKVKP